MPVRDTSSVHEHSVLLIILLNMVIKFLATSTAGALLGPHQHPSAYDYPQSLVLLNVSFLLCTNR